MSLKRRALHSFRCVELGRRPWRVTSSRQITKQLADGREQTPMVFRSNRQNARRLATGRENPHSDENRARAIPASQPIAARTLTAMRHSQLPGSISGRQLRGTGTNRVRPWADLQILKMLKTTSSNPRQSTTVTRPARAPRSGSATSPPPVRNAARPLDVLEVRRE